MQANVRLARIILSVKTVENGLIRGVQTNAVGVPSVWDMHTAISVSIGSRK